MANNGNSPLPSSSAPPSMEAAAERIVGRPLTGDERKMFIELRDQYGYDDTDPLVPVLAMLGAFTLLVKELPDEIRKAAAETIELHRVGMREQTALIAKETVSVVAEQILATGRSWRGRLVDASLGGFVVAVLVGAVWLGGRLLR